ncbi:MAG: trehalose-phosphatase [Betaproteobacteria bacterium]|nr:MAG: trehalose-phosphatase [Betaproteobacteria bacterium]
MPPFVAGWALFLDVDGTLLDHAEHPQAVHVEAGLLRQIEDLLEVTDGALALISGRSVEDLDRLFAPLAVPLAGQHGTERRSANGALHRHEPALECLGRAAAQLVRLTSAHGAFLLENKGMTLALHFRRAPELGALAEREMRRIAAALGDEFELQAGKFVLEIKPSGKDKGTAIAEFMAETPFKGRIPVFLGDDLTDEYGFDVVNRAGGHAIKVGPGATHARWRLADAAAVRRWLGEYLAHCGRLMAAQRSR